MERKHAEEGQQLTWEQQEKKMGGKVSWRNTNNKGDIKELQLKVELK